MTTFGQYLETVVPQLKDSTGNGNVRLINRGLRGFCTMLGVFRVGSDVLPSAPDLLLIEFSHNDLTPFAIGSIPAALHGLVSQVRAQYPACEFAFVYLAQPGYAAAGPTPAMLSYEEVAEHFGFPSIDMATPTEAMVAAGEATWEGAPDSLTHDGIHYTQSAVEVLGRPFGLALARIIASNEEPPLPVVPAIRSIYDRTAWRPASAFISSGQWAIGDPLRHEVRNADAYAGTVAQAVEAASMLTVAFYGSGSPYGRWARRFWKWSEGAR